MLASIVIGPSPDLSDEVEFRCASSQNICVHKTLSGYRTPYELTRLLNLLTPQIVFLEIGFAGALWVARDIRAICPQMPIVGYARHCDPEELHEAEEAGVTGVLPVPFTAERLQQVVACAVEEQARKVSTGIFVFLPAKAGSGASTTALHTASALARNGKRKVLLIDADLHSGLLAVLLGQTPEKSIMDALGDAERLDERRWNALAVRGHGLDLLAAPRIRPRDGYLLSPWNYLHLLGFVRARYRSVIVDLPEVVSEAAEALVQQAKTVYVVCTPEIPSLVLARRRICELEAGGVDERRLRVVLNRHTKRDLKIQKVQEVLQRKLEIVLPNDYAAVRRATLEARPLKGGSKIAKAFLALAHLLEGGASNEQGKSRWNSSAKLIGSLVFSGSGNVV